MARFILPLLVAVAASVSAAGDYFPLEKGNGWTFSYQSSQSVVYPNAPVTRDSGTVTWEALGAGSDDNGALRQVRSLARRFSKRNDTLLYDSIFNPSRMSVDTIVFAGVNTSNSLILNGATCPCMVHDPTAKVEIPVTFKDTSVYYNGAALDAIKATPQTCSCAKMRLWSFVAAPTIGPVTIAISACGAGMAFYETRTLISRSYPVSVNHPGTVVSGPPTLSIVGYSDRIVCAMEAFSPSKASLRVYDLRGKLVMTLFDGTLNRGGRHYIWKLPLQVQGLYVVRLSMGMNHAEKTIAVSR